MGHCLSHRPATTIYTESCIYLLTLGIYCSIIRPLLGQVLTRADRLDIKHLFLKLLPPSLRHSLTRS